MPIRTRKRRATRAGEIEAWREVFECEFDYSDQLPDIGVKTDEYGLPDREVARQAWLRLGAQFMAVWRSTPRHPDQLDPWALTEFGEPPCP